MMFENRKYTIYLIKISCLIILMSTMIFGIISIYNFQFDKQTLKTNENTLIIKTGSKSKNSDGSCDISDFKYYIGAFFLGAYWNMGRIHKFGIL